MSRPLASRRVELLLLLLLAPTYAYFYQSGQHNEAVRFDLTRALAEDHTVEIDRYAYNTADAIEHVRNGRRVILSGKAPGTSLLAVPFFWSFARLTAPLPLPERVHWHVVAWLTTAITVGLLSALGAIAMYTLARRRTGDAWASLLAVLAVWLGTICFPFSTLFFGHQQVASLFAIVLALIAGSWRGTGSADDAGAPGDAPADAAASLPATTAASPADSSSSSASSSSDDPPGSPNPLALLLAGFLAGWAVVSEYPAVLLAAIASAYLACRVARLPIGWRRRAGLLAVFAAGLLAAVSVLVPYNLVAFGRLFYVPYQAYTEAGTTAFPAHRQGVVGLHWPGLKPYLDVVAELTVRPQRGLVYLGLEGLRPYATNPVMWLAVPGIFLMLRRREWRLEGLLALCALLVYLTFNACFGNSIVYWGGGHSVGPRQLIPMLPFLALPLAVAARRLRFVFYPLLALSVFFMLAATAVEPRAPYMYKNPAKELYLPQFLAGHLALSRDGLFDETAEPLIGSSVAFNVGGLLGLPGEWQLAPLLLWWVVVGGALFAAAAANAEPGASGGFSAPRRISPRAWLAILALPVIALPVASRARARLSARAGGLTGRYYPTVDWQGAPADVRVDPAIDFDWPDAPPLPTPFSIEWMGVLHVERQGVYAFAIESDDGSFLDLGQGLFHIDNGGEHAVRRMEASVPLTPGRYRVRLRYFNSALGGRMRFWWRPPERPEEIVPAEALTPEE